MQPKMVATVNGSHGAHPRLVPSMPVSFCPLSLSDHGNQWATNSHILQVGGSKAKPELRAPAKDGASVLKEIVQRHGVQARASKVGEVE